MSVILVIEDEENLRFSIRRSLEKAGHEVSEAATVDEAWALTRSTEFDLLLADVNLAGGDGIDLLRRLRADGYGGVAVVITAYGTVENAVTAMKVGADDYLQKPLSLEELALLVDRHLEQRRVRQRLRLYQRLDAVSGADEGLLGESQPWLDAIGLADRLAGLPITRDEQAAGEPALPTILIVGETGTGKGVVARSIHDRARGNDGGSAPFVHVNCSSLSSEAIEAELFGCEPIAGGAGGREGLLEMTDGATIFLDEIGDMSLTLQARILEVVEEGLFRRAGRSSEHRVRARIIAASNQDLSAGVDAGVFRRDLLYRLNALTIHLPPLRDRGDDAVLIARTVLGRLCRRHGKAGMSLSDDAIAAIREHTWPGNVRELLNVVQRVAMLHDSDTVERADLMLTAGRLSPPSVAPPPAAPLGNGAPAPVTTSNGQADERAKRLLFDFDAGVHTADEVERQLIMQALERTRGNVSKAAKLIRMQRSSLRYRIERFGLEQFVQELAHR